MISRVYNFIGPLSTTFLANQSIISASASGASASLNLLILGDLSVNSIATSLRTQFNRRNLTYSIATVSIGTTYQGNDIPGSSYSVILLYTNGGQYGTLTMSRNIATFAAAGGGFVSSTFYWNVRAGNWPTTISPYSYVGANQGTAILTFTFSPGSHPILIGVTQTQLSNNNIAALNTSISLISGATNIASYSAYPTIAVGTTGSGRLVGINYFPVYISSYPNGAYILSNCILWAAKII